MNRTEILEQQHGDTRPNKFIYPEFEGPAGEEYLNIVLQRILPLALWRTWHWAVSFQAPGRELYVGVHTLEKKVLPKERKLYLDLQEFVGRGLLRITHDWVPVVENGIIKEVVAAIKDFSNLYDLAHEYHEWCQRPTRRIEAKREHRELALEEGGEELVQKLCRFYEYKRAWVDKKPGRKPKPQETWYTPENVTGVAIVNTYLNTSVNTDSLYPLNDDPLNSNPPTDSYESDSHFLLEEKDEMVARRTGSNEGNEERNALSQPITTKSNETQIQRVAMEAWKAKISPDAAKHARYDRYDRTRPNELVKSFLDEFSSVLGDQNRRASVTRTLRMIEHHGLERDMDILMCLVRAYQVARDTVKISHYNRDGSANRAPLFLSMFARFASANFQVDEQDVAGLIAEDDGLVKWLVEYKHPERCEQEAAPPEPPALRRSPARTIEPPIPVRIVEEPPIAQDEWRRAMDAKLAAADRQRVEAEAAANRIRRKLARAGLDVSIGMEHICGSRLYWKREDHRRCVSCQGNPLWPESIQALIAEHMQK